MAQNPATAGYLTTKIDDGLGMVHAGVFVPSLSIKRPSDGSPHGMQVEKSEAQHLDRSRENQWIVLVIARVEYRDDVRRAKRFQLVSQFVQSADRHHEWQFSLGHDAPPVHGREQYQV
ncbi:protein of unknown function [Magnetospirillum sp. XM-1]|nr:protein of unknown function [Magnetospirillum sp. XM-1]